MDYYYRNNLQQEEGPLPEEILRDWLKLGQINESTYVRRCDSGVWMPAADAFCAPKGPAVLLSPAPSVPAEPSASPLNNVKARFIGGAVLALLVFIAYQKSQRGNALAPQQPVATQQKPQLSQPQEVSPLEASHKLVRIGLSYLYGVHGNVDIDAALQSFIEASQQGDSCGKFWACWVIDDNKMDCDSNELTASYKSAFEEISKYVNQGDGLAKLCAGCAMICSENQAVNQLGLLYLESQKDAGDPIAAIEYARSLLVAKNAESKHVAFQIIRSLSDSGIVRAEFLTGLCYLGGIGTEKNGKKGVELVQKAAEKGDPKAKCVNELIEELTMDEILKLITQVLVFSNSL